MTVTDVANLAGVSQATVSKVINNYPTVSADNVRRVHQAMRQLNYQPMPRKRIGSTLPLETVAVLIFHGNQFYDYRHSFFRMLRSIEAAMRQKKMDMVLAHVSSVDDLPEIVRRRQVSGLILQGRNPNDDILNFIQGIPCVWLSSHHDASGHVLLEGNESIGRLAAEYLIGRGHQRLGVLNAMGGNPVLDLRCRYFEFIAQQGGCRCDALIGRHGESWVHDEDLDLALFEQQVAEQVDAFMALKDRPTGMFIPLDLQVAMVYRLLDQRGLRAGRDVDIVGSDEEKVALIGLNPRPATINVGPRAMGERAVQELCWRIEHGSADERIKVTVAPELVPGE
ncbi:MAG: LacI family DNA-binding transcriptional regulator [Phycisphaeraceae bacterium]|nr:LacI family DNA-binding transcriptional regulator [Phycisphaeraceae bacterium]